ncbi:hypothetical protein [Caulobacter sp. S45]|uniref:hypothetical protein n=1 Tax=Caulobacter sp. S45 TaxID=1641861 RepID=UPI001576D84F|nr:hypothetical protein [Caulobacter sp. S45]
MKSHSLVVATTLLCAVAASACLPTRPMRPTTLRYSVQGWLLTIHTDPFTKEATCRLVNRLGLQPDVTAKRGSFTFRVSSHRDTSDAWYRVDGGPPHSWRDTIPALIDTGSMAQAEQLDRPEGGLVTIPREALARARVVVIRAARKTAPQRFDLQGAWRLLPETDRVGCRLG